MIDPLRHIDVFSPDAWGSRRIDVIGAGATGSKVAMSLAKLGIINIHVWDFDKVEAHNVGNQLFGNDDIGKLKVEALKEMVERQTGTKITTHNERVDGTQELGHVVFLLTDTMSSRKEIFAKGLKFKLRTKLMIETRLGADGGRIYVINPSKLPEVKGWEDTLYGDDVAEVSACGASITVGPTAGVVAEAAVWQVIRAFAIENGDDDEIDNEILLNLRQPLFITRKFD
jgi:molybdopterin/thiamine biosynthesis adenylyltransferase